MIPFYFFRCVTIALCFLLAGMGGYAREAKADYTPKSGQPGKDVIWVPTSDSLVEAMLETAKVTSSDYVIDLGSGDGRIVIAAAKLGAEALGIEYNPDLVEYAKRAAAAAGVSAKARFEKADIFEYDFSKASVLTLFLLSELNLKLKPIILDMKPGTRVVSNTFDMGDWEPDQTIRPSEQYGTGYFWIVPAKVDGIWKFGRGQISFTQKFQKITGTMTVGKEETELVGMLTGDSISFTAGDREYTGTVRGNTISGKHDGGGTWKITR